MKVLFWTVFNNVIVAVGTIVCSLAVAKHHDIFPCRNAVALLGIVVWLIYTIDRLFDSRLAKNKLSERHRHYNKYRKPLIILSIVLFVTCLFLLDHISHSILLNGLKLGTAVCLYLFLNTCSRIFQKYLKEISTALIYGTGIFVPISASFADFSQDGFLLWASFVFIAFINLILFSIRDIKSDIESNFASLAVSLGKKSANRLVIACFVLLTATIFIPDGPISSLGVMFLAMGVTLLSLQACMSRIKSEYLFRLMGDGVFLYPIVYLLIN